MWMYVCCIWINQSVSQAVTLHNYSHWRKRRPGERSRIWRKIWSLGSREQKNEILTRTRMRREKQTTRKHETRRLRHGLVTWRFVFSTGMDRLHSLVGLKRVYVIENCISISTICLQVGCSRRRNTCLQHCRNLGCHKKFLWPLPPVQKFIKICSLLLERLAEKQAERPANAIFLFVTTTGPIRCTSTLLLLPFPFFSLY